MDSATLRRRLSSSGYEALRTRLTDGGRAEVRSGSDTLFHARYGCYLVLGFEPEQAFFLAMAPEVGILDAVNLIENDCPHETAVSILV